MGRSVSGQVPTFICKHVRNILIQMVHKTEKEIAQLVKTSREKIHQIKFSNLIDVLVVFFHPGIDTVVKSINVCCKEIILRAIYTLFILFCIKKPLLAEKKCIGELYPSPTFIHTNIDDRSLQFNPIWIISLSCLYKTVAKFTGFQLPYISLNMHNYL